MWFRSKRDILDDLKQMIDEEEEAPDQLVEELIKAKGDFKTTDLGLLVEVLNKDKIRPQARAALAEQMIHSKRILVDEKKSALPNIDLDRDPLNKLTADLIELGTGENGDNKSSNPLEEKSRLTTIKKPS